MLGLTTRLLRSFQGLTVGVRSSWRWPGLTIQKLLLRTAANTEENPVGVRCRREIVESSLHKGVNISSEHRHKMLRRFGRRRRDDQLRPAVSLRSPSLLPARLRSAGVSGASNLYHQVALFSSELRTGALFDLRSSIASPPRLHSFPALLECLSANRPGVLIWQCKFAWERP